MTVRTRRETPSSDGVAGGFGGVLAAGWCGPADVAGGELLGVPARVLLGPVIVAAGRVPVAQTRPAARLIRDVVLKVAAFRGRRTPARCTSRAGSGPGGGA